MFHDLRYAIRSLRKTPGFAATVIVTLALGIGANTAIFSALYGVVLAPMPFRDPGALWMVLLYNRALKHVTYCSYPDFLDWRRASRSFERIAAFTDRGFDVTNPGAPEHLNGEEISAAFFATLGVTPALGRDLSDDEDRFGAPASAIISDRFWQTRFARDPAVIGRAITLNGDDYTVIGVLPPSFRFGEGNADVYTAIGRGDPQQRASRIVHNIGAIARLKPGIEAGEARAEMNAVQERIGAENPATERGQGIEFMTLQQFFVGDVSGVLMLLSGAVGLVLLIACANVANLLLARSASREREFAVRVALGAGRARIAGQTIVEGVVLALAGGMLGLAIAKWGLGVVLASVAKNLPRAENIGLNVPVLLFAFLISIAAGVLFGVTPAFRNSTRDLPARLKDGVRGSKGRPPAQRVLAVVEIAMAMVLLAGASLLMRTIRNLWDANPGFDPRDVITFKAGVAPGTPEQTRVALAQLTGRIRGIPGVAAADLTALLPFSQRDNSGGFWIGSQSPGSIAELPRAIYYWTGPDYLRVMGIPLLRGRYLDAHDTAEAEHVIVIDNTLARTYFHDADPVGQMITIPNWTRARIVGVVGHVNHYRMGADPYARYQIYGSFYQLGDDWVPAFREDLSIAVRTTLAPAALMPQIKSAVFAAESNQPVYNVRTMTGLVSGSMAAERLPMILLSAFAALAMILASVGIYGVFSYSMTQRTREMGIRMALGAARGDVVRMVLGDGLRLALAGVAIGGAAAFALTRMLASFSALLYGVGAGDPWTFAGVSIALTLAALAACYLPARRASRLDPMDALREW
jgi:predicted permease